MQDTSKKISKADSLSQKYDKIVNFILPYLFLIFGFALTTSITLIEICKAVLILIYIPYIIQNRSLFKRNYIFFTLLVFVFLFILSTIFSEDVSRSFDGYAKYSNILLFPVGLVSITIHKDKLKWLLFGLIIGSIFQFIWIVASIMKNIESYDELRPSGTYTKPALYASIAAITALLTLSIPYILKKHNDSKKRKILYHTIFYVVSIIIFFGIILSKTRGAMIAIAFSYFLYLFLHFLFLNRTKRLIIIFIIILILVICFLLILINIFPSILSKLESIINYFGSYEGNIRLNIYKTAWNEILEHPIIGNGPNTFHFYYQEKLYSWHSHNNYLEIAYGSGIPALITFLVMEIMLMLKLIKYIINKNKKHINKIIALSILCAYITNILYGLSDYIIFAVTASPLLFFGIGLVSNIQALDNT